MKGQRLFVRPMRPEDVHTLEGLTAGSGDPAGSASEWQGEGLVGRLAGSTVAGLCWRRDGKAMVISRIVVAVDLRGLGIGKTLLADAERLARDAGASELRVERDCKFARYFERRGFVSSGETLSKTTR